ncbi:hypothetical protein MTQ24_07645 [Corynebacterium bovis]
MAAASTAMPSIASRLRVTAPSTAVDPPTTLLPAPRGTTGTWWAVANRMTARTSSSSRARTTASGVPAPGSIVRSRR